MKTTNIEGMGKQQIPKEWKNNKYQKIGKTLHCYQIGRKEHRINVKLHTNKQTSFKIHKRLLERELKELAESKLEAVQPIFRPERQSSDNVSLLKIILQRKI